MEDLDTLWIIDSKGLCLLQQVFNPNKNPIDKTMVSGFVSAIISFSDRVFDDSLEQISMGKLDVHCLSFSNGKFLVAIAVKRGANLRYIHQKMREVGEAFEAEFGDQLDQEAVCLDNFTPFIDTIDKIFGIKTITVIPEHGELLDLLTTAEEGQFSEYRTIEAILYFFEKIPLNRRKILLQTTFPILSIFIKSENLTIEQNKRFQEILSIQE